MLSRGDGLEANDWFFDCTPEYGEGGLKSRPADLAELGSVRGAKPLVNW